MPTPKAGGLIRGCRRRPRLGHIRDLEVAEYAVVAITAVGLGEQAEEKKNVADANALVGEVALGRSGLAEGAATRFEHGIVVTEIGGGEPTARCPLDD